MIDLPIALFLHRVVRCEEEISRKGEIAVVVEPVQLWSELKWIHGWRVHYAGLSQNDSVAEREEKFDMWADEDDA